MLDGLKDALYQRKLNQCTKLNKKRIATNFDNARKIGLLFNATNEADTVIVMNYKKELQRLRKKVSLMAFKDVKDLKEELDFPCFCRKDLTFSGVPKKQEVLSFIQEPFDLLISLHITPCQPLEYISAASAAHFRIGHYQEDKTDFYDVMVYGKSNSLRALTQQIETYLQKIK